MIFQILVFLVIVLIAAYLATQGWFSAMLSFICATFASILAAAWYSPMAGPISGWKPDYGHGVTFLLTFFLAFSALRIAADLMVPENVALPKWLEWSAGGLLGFMAAMVLAGTMVIGIEMMPVGTSLMPLAGIAGFNRYPEGLRTERSGLWLNPDGFAEWIYDMTCGRSLGSAGGKYTFEQAHPDLRTELWGYRERVGLASVFAQRPELMTVTGLWAVENPGAAWPGAKESFPGDVSRAIVMRTEFERGLGEKISADQDELFRASASQIRLVAMRNNGSGETRQFYPVGYIDHGPAAKRYLKYEPLGPYGHVVLDFPAAAASGSGKGNAVIEWVYALPDEYTPTFVEAKVLARLDLPAVEKSAPALAGAYPPVEWLNKPFALTVKLQDESSGTAAPLKNQTVYIMRNAVKNTSIMSTLVTAAQTLEANRDSARDSANGWISDPKDPGTVSFMDLQNAARQSREAALDKGDTAMASWDTVLRATIPSAMTPKGSANVEAVKNYLNNTIKPLLEKNESARKTMNTGESGKTGTETFGEGDYVAIAWYSTPDTIYIWSKSFKAEQKKTEDLELTTKDRTFPFRVTTKAEAK